MSFVDRLRKLPLPAGTIPVAIGLALAGLTQYGFLIVAARALGQTRFAPLSVFWALLLASICGISIRASPRMTCPDWRSCSASTVASGSGALKVSRRMREPVTTISSTPTAALVAGFVWACANPGAQR